MKILITGGAGFIGSQVADRYAELGHQIVVVDNLTTGNRQFLPAKAKFYPMDIASDEMNVLFEKEKPEMVNHLAAQIDIQKSISDPYGDAQQNIMGSLKLFTLCQKHDVKKIIFSSSGGAIYGEQTCLPADEASSPAPQNPYGIAKLSIEKYLQFFQSSFGIPFVALRYANVYGPRQKSDGEGGVAAIFIHKILRGESPIIFGDGNQTRDFIYVRDVVQCNEEALKSENRGIFNVGTGIETTISFLAQNLIQLSGHSKISIHMGPKRPGEVQRSALKPGKIQKNPPTPLITGLKATLNWFRKNAASIMP